MATFPTPQQAHPPPDLPSMDISPTLSNYLRTFSLWCRKGFATKLDNTTALSGIMLQAYDAPAGTAPNVYLLRVNQAGNFVSSPVSLGGGKP